MKIFILVMTILLVIANSAMADVVLCMVSEGKGVFSTLTAPDGSSTGHYEKENDYKVYGVIDNSDWTKPQIKVQSKFFKEVRVEVSACTKCGHTYNKDHSLKALHDIISTKIINAKTGGIVSDFAMGDSLGKIVNYEPSPRGRINLNCGISNSAK